MRNTVSLFKRFGAVFLCLTLLCGVIMSTMVFPAAATPSGVKRFSADFSELKNLVESDKFDSKGYYAAGENDTAITQWVNNRFKLTYHRENNVRDRDYLGTSSGAYDGSDSWGGNAWWSIGNDGYLHYDAYNDNGFTCGGQMLRKSDLLTVKTEDGKLARFENFEASLVFNKSDKNLLGAVYFSFHEQSPAKINTSEDARYGGIQVPEADMVILGNSLTYTYGQATNEGITYKPYGAYGPTYPNTRVAEALSVSTLDNSANYVLNVKCVGTNLTIKVTSEDGATTYYNQTKTIEAGHEGYFSVGAANGSRALKSLTITELDKDGNEVDFGYASYTPFEFSVRDVIPYSGDKYETNEPFFVFVDKTSDAANTVFSHITSAFNIYYNSEAKYVSTPITQNSSNAYEGQDDNHGYFAALYMNRWLERNATNSGGWGEMFRLISSLVPKNTAGKEVAFKNFETSFDVRFGDNVSAPRDGGVILGFRQATAGKFVNSYYNINKEQGVVAISKTGITIAAGDGISDEAYNANVTANFDQALPQVVKVFIRVLNDKVTVKITKDDGTTLWTNESAPATVGRLVPGKIAYGLTSQKQSIGDIALTHLDSDGKKISIDQATDEEQTTGIETFQLSFDGSDMNAVQAKADFYFNHEGKYAQVQPTGNAVDTMGSGNWVFDGSWFKRTNVQGWGERVRQINAMVPKDVNDYKVTTKNVSASFDYRFGSEDGALLFGFRQKTPARFVNGFDYMNTEQAMVAISRQSIDVAGGTDITKEKFYTYDPFATAFASTLPETVHVDITAIGKDCKVEIYNEGKTQKLYSNTFTVNYEESGYLALGVAAVDGSYANIRLVRLDDAGKPVDWTDSSYQDEIPDDGVVRFNADFAKLAALVENFDADGYYTSKESDYAINSYVANKFLLRYNNEHTRNERAYLGQSSAAYQNDAGWGGNSYWRIGSNGSLLRHTTIVGGEMMRKNDMLYLKTANGYTAMLKNFEASYVVEDFAQARGAVTLSFRSNTTDRVVAAFNQVYPEQETVMIGIDGDNKFGIAMGSGADHISGDTGTYRKLQQEISALRGVTEYRVTVRAVEDKLTVKITSMNGRTVYFDNTGTPATLKRNDAGYIAVSISNSPKALKKLVVTELDAAGNPINFGTNTKAPYDTFSFSVTDSIPMDSNGNYVIDGESKNPWYDFAGAYGENATGESSKLISMLDAAFASYYNQEANYGQLTVGTTTYSESLNDLHYFGGVYANKWLASATSGQTGMQTMRLIASLVPRNSDTGEELQMKNFETTYQFRFEGDSTAVLGFRQRQPGKFADAYWALNQQQAFVAITKTGITIAGGDGIVSNMKKDANGDWMHLPGEGDMYGQIVTQFKDANGDPIELPQNITIRVRVVNSEVIVAISTEGGTLLWSNESAPATIDYDKIGYIAYGIGSVRGNLADINLTRLDDNGEPIDINGGNGPMGFKEWDTSTTRYSKQLGSMSEDVSAAYDYYYSSMVSGTPTTVSEPMAAHWAVANGYMTRQNDMDGKDTEAVAMAAWKMDGTDNKLKDLDAIFKIKLDAGKPGTFWVTARQADAASVGKVVRTPGEQDYLQGQVAVGLRVGGELVIATGNGSAVTIPGTAVGTPTGNYILRVKVYGNQVQVYLNGALRAVRTLDASASQAGYLCFGASGSPFGISEVIVNKLCEYGVPVDFTTTYSSVQQLEPRIVGANADPSALNLPTTLTVMNGSSQETSRVYWDMNSIDLTLDGDYTLIGYLENTNGVRASVPVLVGAYDRDITESYTFSTQDALAKFDTWFLPEQMNPGKDLIKVTGTENDCWQIQNGMLRYKETSLNRSTYELEQGVEIDGRFWQDTTGWSEYSVNMGVAVLKERTYKNFILDVDFKATYRWVGLGFGAANTPDGVYWSTKNGGYTFYIESGGNVGTLSYKYTDKDGEVSFERYDGFFNPYNASGTHHLRLIVSDGTAYFSLDGLEPFQTTLPSYDGGYLYFALNDANGGFDNLRITDLDAKMIEITGIKDMQSLVTIDRAAGDTLQLSNFLTGVTAEKYEYPISVTWANDTYRSYKEGEFTFTGSGSPLHNMTLTQSFNDAAKLTVDNQINGDFDPNTQKKYYFDHVNDILDFNAYYAKREDRSSYWSYGENEFWTSFEGNLVKADKPTDRWTVVNGALQASYTTPGVGWNRANTLRYVSTLVLENLNLKHYQVDIDVKQGSSWFYNYVILGINDPTKIFGTLHKGEHATPDGSGTDVDWAPASGCGAWTYLEQEGYFNGQGSVYTHYYAYRYETDIDSQFIETFQRNKTHHLQYRVTDGLVSMQVKDPGNESDVYYMELDSAAYGGYLGLGNYGNAGSFANLTITALDPAGKTVPLAQAEKGMATTETQNYVGWIPKSSDWKFNWAGYEN